MFLMSTKKVPLTSESHVITGTLLINPVISNNNDESSVNINKTNCFSKAGTSLHIAVVLLYILYNQ